MSENCSLTRHVIILSPNVDSSQKMARLTWTPQALDDIDAICVPAPTSAHLAWRSNANTGIPSEAYSLFSGAAGLSLLPFVRKGRSQKIQLIL